MLATVQHYIILSEYANLSRYSSYGDVHCRLHPLVEAGKLFSAAQGFSTDETSSAKETTTKMMTFANTRLHHSNLGCVREIGGCIESLTRSLLSVGRLDM